MKFILSILGIAFYCGLCNAECSPQANMAVNFINEYKKYNDDYFSSKTNEERDDWISRNKSVTNKFKVAYNKIIEDAKKEELGLDYDPIFVAQDYPDLGYEVYSCDEKSNFVFLKDVNGNLYKLVVKVIKSNKGWLIDGAGIVNIPIQVINNQYEK